MDKLLLGGFLVAVVLVAAIRSDEENEEETRRFFLQRTSNNNLDSICLSDAECGPNEVCWMPDFDPPCKSGICVCKNCYHNVDEYSSCKAVQQINLGSSCAPSLSIMHGPVIYPPNADCSPDDNFIVKCLPDWQSNVADNASFCIEIGTADESDRCIDEMDCLQGLSCNNNLKCQCHFSYEKWDESVKKCFRRDFDDPCSIDYDCQVNGIAFDGFTWKGGNCSPKTKRCSCSPEYTSTPVSYIDWNSGQVRSKLICLKVNSTLDRPLGSRCSIDPVYNSDRNDTAVCLEPAVCFQCPEEAEEFLFPLEGTCRSIRGSLRKLEPISECYSAPFTALQIQSQQLKSINNKSSSNKVLASSPVQLPIVLKQGTPPSFGVIQAQPQQQQKVRHVTTSSLAIIRNRSFSLNYHLLLLLFSVFITQTVVQ